MHLRQILPAALAIVAGCTERQVTFDDVAPALAHSCTHCHMPGGIAPFSLETYDDAAPIAGELRTAVESREMPPWDAVRDGDCEVPLPYLHDESLSDDDRETFALWVKQGVRIGKRNTTAVAAQPPKLESWNLTAAMPAAYQPRKGADDFHCFVIDPGLTTDRYVTAIDFVAGNRTLVHHSSLLADPTRAMASKIGPGGYDCSTEVTSAPVRELDPFTPGVGPDVYPVDLSRMIPAGSLFILALHYAGHIDTSTQLDVPDLSEFHLQTVESPTQNTLVDWMFGGITWASDSPPRLLAGPDDRGAVEFHIPLGTTAHTEEMEIPIGEGGRLYAIQAHAHFAATEIRADLKKANGSRVCLLKDHWRFQWQRRYTFDAPESSLIALDPGDVVDVKCTYNDSPSNQALVAFRNAVGIDLGDIDYGGRATDEMCHVMLHIVTPQ